MAHLRVVHWQWLVIDRGLGSRDANDFVRELFYRHLPWITQINRLVEIAHRESENSVDEIRHITERAGLRAVAKNAQRLTAQSLPDKCRHDAAVAQTHPRAISVEDSHDPGVYAMVAVICHRDCFRESFRLVVNAARPDRVHIAPIIFLLRMLERIAIHLRCGSENECGVFVLGQTQRVVRAERADFECRDREFQIINGTGRRGEVKNIINLWFRQKNEIGDVVFHEAEIFVSDKMSNVCRVAGHQIIDGNDPVTFRQKPVHQVRAKKARASGNDGNGLRSFSHSGFVLMAAA